MSTDWRRVFEEQGAIWMHDGRPSRPHALLTSGLHSDGFVNCTAITQRPTLLWHIMSAPEGLPARLPQQPVDWVIGSAYGAITLAHAVALRLRAQAGFTEKDGEEMKLARFEIPSGARVLVVEDTITTGGSTLKTIEGLARAGVPPGNLLPYVVCLVNRSGKDSLGGFRLCALITLDIHTWQPGDCPLCQAGSQPVRPKAHWKELTLNIEH